MQVLIVEPMAEPVRAEVENSLPALQEAVGGYIEAVYPFRDDVALICNESGKLEGLPLNRGLFDDSGKLYDVVAGTFLVTGLTEDGFGDLSPECLEKYSKRFRLPEQFFLLDGSVCSVPVPLPDRQKVLPERTDGR